MSRALLIQLFQTLSIKASLENEHFFFIQTTPVEHKEIEFKNLLFFVNLHSFIKKIMTDNEGLCNDILENRKMHELFKFFQYAFENKINYLTNSESEKQFWKRYKMDFLEDTGVAYKKIQDRFIKNIRKNNIESVKTNEKLLCFCTFLYAEAIAHNIFDSKNCLNVTESDISSFYNYTELYSKKAYLLKVRMSNANGSSGEYNVFIEDLSVNDNIYNRYIDIDDKNVIIGTENLSNTIKSAVKKKSKHPN